jgi:hypothetical protein
LGLPGTESLLEAELPEYDPENVEDRVQMAIQKYRYSRASLGDRRDAVRDLADALEYLRPKVKKVLTKKDEGDLFNILNNFGIRHQNTRQQSDYDEEIWLNWLFYFYLAGYHACIRLIKKREENDES